MKVLKHHPTVSMNYREQFRVKPGHRIRLQDIDPQFANKEEEKKSAKRAMKRLQKRMDESNRTRGANSAV
jgi:endonuclease YncB( thermonuclease family)